MHNGLSYNCVDCQEQKELKERAEELARGEPLEQSAGDTELERIAAQTTVEVALGVVGAIIGGIVSG